MNIGNVKKNANGQLIGSIVTAALTLTVGLRPVMSNNPKAPKFEMVALNPNRQWAVVGAFFELVATKTGEIFYQGKVDDPSFAAPLYVALFAKDDGYVIAWQRPTRRRDSALEASDYGNPELFDGPGAEAQGDDLGDSTAPAPGRRSRKANASETANGTGTDGDTGEGEAALPPLVDA